MRKEIGQAVKANRRLLGLVDDQLACLAKTTPSVALDTIDADRRMPYWYSATSPQKVTPVTAAGLGSYTPQNAQQSPFILVTQTGTQNPNFGYIRVQSDAAFVATSIVATYSLRTAGNNFASGMISQINVGFRLYDESSNRWLTLTNQDQRIQQDATLPSPFLAPSSLLYSNGQRIPTECTFPRNALIRVEAYVYETLNFADDVLSIYFALGGYKVFGG